MSVNSTDLTYDAWGRMVEQQNGSTYTQILYSPMGKTALMNGQALTKAFVNLPSGAAAIYNSTGLAYYRHSDWLNSSRLTSAAAQTLYSSAAYAPFGEQYDVAGTSDPSFTGQNSDTASTLYDFALREHSPSQGRWISPDPAGLAAVDPTNPQSWNRYAYVINNPLGLVDPLGLIALPCYPNCGPPPPPRGPIQTSSSQCWDPATGTFDNSCATGPQRQALDCASLQCLVGGGIRSNPAVPKPPDPVQKYAQCHDAVQEQDETNEKTAEITAGGGMSDVAAACFFTGPGIGFCEGATGGLELLLEVAIIAGTAKVEYDDDTQCMANSIHN